MTTANNRTKINTKNAHEEKGVRLFNKAENTIPNNKKNSSSMAFLFCKNALNLNFIMSP
jgi:hypothetical protein